MWVALELFLYKALVCNRATGPSARLIQIIDPVTLATSLVVVQNFFSVTLSNKKIQIFYSMVWYSKHAFFEVNDKS